MSRFTSPFEIDSDTTRGSRAPSTSTVSATIDPFTRIMAPGRQTLIELVALAFTIIDRCTRPTLLYNTNYNLFKPARDDLKPNYSLYLPRELLFNNKPIKVVNLPRGYILAPLTKSLTRSWVWKVGYTLTQPTGNNKYSF